MLQRDGTSARVVSIPCVEWFSEQDASYQEEVLPPGIRARASAAYQTLYAEFGITPQRVAEAARTSLARQSAGAGD